MKATAFAIVFALSLQLASAAHGVTCGDLDNLINNINKTILGTCSKNEADCTRVQCMDSPLPGIGVTSITVLPCAFPRPSINVLIFSDSGAVLENVTTYKDERNQVLSLNNMLMYRLDWNIRYNQEEESSLMVHLNGTALNPDRTPNGTATSVIDTTIISLDRSECADCKNLQPLVDNIDPTILGVCGVRTPCSEVACVDSPLAELGESSITVLPCASPRPSLKVLIFSDSGAVLENVTTDKDEQNQVLSLNNMLEYSLDWIIQYNEKESSLMVHLNGTALNPNNGAPIGITASVINTTIIQLDRSECAGAPGMRFMISAVLLSLIIALLAN